MSKYSIVKTVLPVLWILLLHSFPSETIGQFERYDLSVHIDPDIITPNDPSRFSRLDLVDIESRTIPIINTEPNAESDVVDSEVQAYVFAAHYDDQRQVEILVKATDFLPDEANKRARRQAFTLGQMPKSLFDRIEKIIIVAGNLNIRSYYSDSSILIFSEQSDVFRSTGTLEETIFHEAGHIALFDTNFIWNWRHAVEADGGYPTKYAVPRLDLNRIWEDETESLLMFFAARYQSRRISKETKQYIESLIPNRLALIESEHLDMRPYSTDPNKGVEIERINPNPRNGNKLLTKSVMFCWNESEGERFQQTKLTAGTTGPGSTDILNTRDWSNDLFRTIRNLPTNGETIYVRLTSRFTNDCGILETKVKDYEFKAPKQRQLDNLTTLPVANPYVGPRIMSDVVTFGWQKPANVDSMDVYVGEEGFFSNNYFLKMATDQDRYQKYDQLPTDGRDIFVRVVSHSGRKSEFVDYIFKAPTAVHAELYKIDPPNGLSGPVLNSNELTFSWNAEFERASNIAVSSENRGIYYYAFDFYGWPDYVESAQRTRTKTVEIQDDHQDLVTVAIGTRYDNNWYYIHYKFFRE